MVKMFNKLVRRAAAAALSLSVFAVVNAGQAPIPKAVPVEPAVKITKIGQAELAELLKPRQRPLLINFWATWCDPCREEFPDLVAIDAEYKGKIDFITISLDDLAEINRDVPKFLQAMKAEMPAYLLHTPDQKKRITP